MNPNKQFRESSIFNELTELGNSLNPIHGGKGSREFKEFGYLRNLEIENPYSINYTYLNWGVLGSWAPPDFLHVDAFL